MRVETFASVHQMVSLIQGTLPVVERGRRVKQCLWTLKEVFPPGSMTGAPKKRSVELLRILERGLASSSSSKSIAGRRGPYSGVLGYASLSGQADLSVIIRGAFGTYSSTAVDLTVGAGGAITSLSHPEEEYDEMLVKLHSVLPSISCTFGSLDD